MITFPTHFSEVSIRKMIITSPYRKLSLSKCFANNYNSVLKFAFLPNQGQIRWPEPDASVCAKKDTIFEGPVVHVENGDIYKNGSYASWCGEQVTTLFS